MAREARDRNADKTGLIALHACPAPLTSSPEGLWDGSDSRSLGITSLLADDGCSAVHASASLLVSIEPLTASRTSAAYILTSSWSRCQPGQSRLALLGPHQPP